MTPFSNLLSAHIKSKNVKTFSVAQYCGIDRSNMYKILNGKRNPSSAHMVQNISDFLRLTPMERYDLLEAYEITITGYETYYRRKHVEEFIAYFSNKPSPFPDLDFHHIKTDFPPHSDGTIISGKNRLRYMIYHIATAEIQREKGAIQLLFQPDTEEFMDLLAYIGKRGQSLKIEHIFCLNNSDKISQSKYDYNLSCLQKIIPMYYDCICDYTPYSYYDSIVSHDNIFNLLSSMVLTSRYAFIFSPQLQYGFLFSNQDILLKLRDIFEDLKSYATPIVHKMESFSAQFEYFRTMGIEKHGGYSFQREPCMIPLLPLSFPDKYLREIPSDRERTLAMIKQYISQHATASKLQATQYIFTENGVRDFLISGRISELPPSVYRALEYKDRALMVQNLMNACRCQGYRMLKSHTPIASSSLNVYVTSQKGYLMFNSASRKIICLDLNEPGLLHAFYDYLDSLKDSMFYTETEATDILREMLKATRG